MFGKYGLSADFAARMLRGQGATTPRCWGHLVNINSAIWAVLPFPSVPSPILHLLALPASSRQPKCLSIPSSTPALGGSNGVSQDAKLLPKWLRNLSHSLGMGLCNEFLSLFFSPCPWKVLWPWSSRLLGYLPEKPPYTHSQ